MPLVLAAEPTVMVAGAASAVLVRVPAGATGAVRSAAAARAGPVGATPHTAAPAVARRGPADGSAARTRKREKALSPAAVPDFVLIASARSAQQVQNNAGVCCH